MIKADNLDKGACYEGARIAGYTVGRKQMAITAGSKTADCVHLTSKDCDHQQKLKNSRTSKTAKAGKL